MFGYSVNARWLWLTCCQRFQNYLTLKYFGIDEAVPANRGLWVSVVYPGTFDLPESRFQEETGPFNFTPNSSIL
jgi:hypothetical protein